MVSDCDSGAFRAILSNGTSQFLAFYICLLAPSAPPDNVLTGLLNLSSGWAKWSPPPPEHHNGILLGYKIQVKAGNSSKILAQDTVNATIMQVMLHNLTIGTTYNIRVVAYNRVGPGPYSQPVLLVMDPAHVVSPSRAHPSGTASATKGKNILQQTWFLVLLPVMLILILAFVVSGAWYFRKKHLLTKELGHLTGKWRWKMAVCLVGRD